MVKSELITLLAQKNGRIPRNEVEIIVNTIFDSMAQALEKGDRIEIRGFGSFQIRVREARKGVNPKTGAMVNISERRVPFFKAGKELRERVDNRHPSTPSA